MLQPKAGTMARSASSPSPSRRRGSSLAHAYPSTGTACTSPGSAKPCSQRAVRRFRGFDRFAAHGALL
ncbi:hypothetical protein, conserved [Leishmania tarentolae]|uniref:Uncharacterized protein n=1 Tax=Leishmania tarentolae TaxID=5689 RepID=A0A640KIE4_LEITA|nr:hypothetical protein, conserved [Leishmania tarentolae]